jgi:hypothetical protein
MLSPGVVVVASKWLCVMRRLSHVSQCRTRMEAKPDNVEDPAYAKGFIRNDDSFEEGRLVVVYLSKIA